MEIQITRDGSEVDVEIEITDPGDVCRSWQSEGHSGYWETITLAEPEFEVRAAAINGVETTLTPEENDDAREAASAAFYRDELWKE